MADWMREAIAKLQEIVASEIASEKADGLTKEALIGGDVNFNVSGPSPSAKMPDTTRRRREEEPEQRTLFAPRRDPVPKGDRATPKPKRSDNVEPGQFDSKFNKFIQHLKNLSPFKKKEQPQTAPAAQPSGNSAAPQAPGQQLQFDFNKKPEAPQPAAKPAAQPQTNPVQQRVENYRDQIQKMREQHLHESPQQALETANPEKAADIARKKMIDEMIQKHLRGPLSQQPAAPKEPTIEDKKRVMDEAKQRAIQTKQTHTVKKNEQSGQLEAVPVEQAKGVHEHGRPEEPAEVAIEKAKAKKEKAKSKKEQPAPPAAEAPPAAQETVPQAGETTPPQAQEPAPAPQEQPQAAPEAPAAQQPAPAARKRAPRPQKPATQPPAAAAPEQPAQPAAEAPAPQAETPAAPQPAAADNSGINWGAENQFLMDPKNDAVKRDNRVEELAKQLAQNNVSDADVAKIIQQHIPRVFQRSFTNAFKEAKSGHEPAAEAAPQVEAPAPVAEAPQPEAPAAEAAPAPSAPEQTAPTPATPARRKPTAKAPAQPAAVAPAPAPAEQPQEPNPAPQPAAQTPAQPTLTPAAQKLRDELSSSTTSPNEKMQKLRQLIDFVDNGKIDQQKFDSIVPKQLQNAVNQIRKQKQREQPAQQPQAAPSAPQQLSAPPPEFQENIDALNEAMPSADATKSSSFENMVVNDLAKKIREQLPPGDQSWKQWVPQKYQGQIEKSLSGGLPGKYDTSGSANKKIQKALGQTNVSVSPEDVASLGKAPGAMPKQVANALSQFFGETEGAAEQMRGGQKHNLFGDNKGKFSNLYQTLWTSPDNGARAQALADLIDEGAQPNPGKESRIIPPDMMNLYNTLMQRAGGEEEPPQNHVAASIQRVEELIKITSHLKRDDFELLASSFLHDGYEPDEIAKAFEYHYTNRI